MIWFLPFFLGFWRRWLGEFPKPPGHTKTWPPLLLLNKVPRAGKVATLWAVLWLFTSGWVSWAVTSALVTIWFVTYHHLANDGVIATRFLFMRYQLGALGYWLAYHNRRVFGPNGWAGSKGDAWNGYGETWLGLYTGLVMVLIERLTGWL